MAAEARATLFRSSNGAAPCNEWPSGIDFTVDHLA